MTPSRFSPYYVCLLVLFAVISSCHHRKQVVTRAYYFWRNGSAVDPEEKEFLRNNAIRKVYAKCLDIDWNEVNHAYPLTINPVHEIAYGFQHYSDSVNATVVPVIFITNKTFLQIDTLEMAELVTHILRKCIPGFDELSVRNYGFLSYPIPSEIQFDCDWSAATKNKYFRFLQEVRHQLGSRKILLSATVRLHQYKYPELTGVPPVDRGMLMVYNISKLTEYTPVNSIFDEEKASAYFTKRKAYPLALDIALPAYSWGIIFRRSKFFQIENALTEDTLRKSAFLQHSGQHFYKVLADTVFCDVYLRPGDEIKIEQIDERTLLQAAKLAGKAINTDSFAVALFELSTQEITNYSHETIEQVYNGFNH